MNKSLWPIMQVTWLLFCGLSLSAQKTPILGDRIDAAAWKNFEDLVNPTESDNPAWLKWTSKQEACFESSQDGWRKLVGEKQVSIDIRAAEIPSQEISAAQQVRSNLFSLFVRNYLKHPLLASVLFSDTAYKSLCPKLNPPSTRSSLRDQFDSLGGALGDARTMKSLYPSSIAIKLIWIIYPVIPNKPAKLPVVDQHAPPQPSADQLPPLQVWKTRYLVDISKPDQCPPHASTATDNLAIPLGCFYFRRLTAKEGLQVDTAAVLDYTNSLGAREVYALLVGIHLMQLTPEHPKWRWSTYYWTEEEVPHDDPTSIASWQAKWKHFQVMSTDDVPENYLYGNKHKFAYSPYVEGIQPGVHANCLSCHSYAAYFPNGAAEEQQPVSVFKAYGNNDFASINRANSYNSYFQNGIATSFLWSVADAAAGPGLIEDTREKFIKEIVNQQKKSKRDAGASSFKPGKR
jgi:hypothetical protein